MLQEVDIDTLEKGFCGPFALAATTGIPLSKAIAALKKVKYGSHWTKRRLNPRIKGIWNSELSKAFKELGFELIRDPRDASALQKTLFQWSQTLFGEKTEATYVININNHYLAVQGNNVVDTFTHGKKVPIESYAKKKSKIQYIWRVVKTGRANYIPMKKFAKDAEIEKAVEAAYLKIIAEKEAKRVNA